MTRWWRSHASALDDPKVQRLPGDLFKSWFNVLCIASLRDGILPPLPDIAFALRKSEEATSKVLDQLKDAGLLDVTEAGMTPHNWTGRQYKSDVSNERVKRFRERHGNGDVTLQKRPQRTEADTEQNRTEGEARKRAQRLPEDWQASIELLKFAADLGLDGKETAANFKDYWDGEGSAKARKLDWDAAFRVWCRREAKAPSRQAKSFAQQAADRASSVTSRDDEGQWRARLRAYKPGGFWLEHEWGPPPESGQSRVPAAVLKEWQQ